VVMVMSTAACSSVSASTVEKSATTCAGVSTNARPVIVEAGGGVIQSC